MVFGLVLAAIELASPGGFFVIFFGIAAVVVGALELAGLAGSDWLQWLLFPVIAVVALRLFRRPLLARMQLRDTGREVDSLVGQVAIAITDMAPLQHGRAELRGTTWNARNADRALVASGQRCRVVAVDGLMLDLVAE